MKFSKKILDITWIIFLLVMPISSFRPLSQLMGGTNVAPLAIIPTVVIIFLFWLPSFFKSGKKLPYQVKPLLLFFLVGCFSTLLVSFRNVPTFQGFSLKLNIVEVFITFAMGVSYYLVTIFMVKNKNELHQTLRWISISGIILMAYSWLQVITWLVFRNYPGWMFSLNAFISSSGKLFEHRASGLAFEPSWLAHQLNIIFIPLWFGLSISGQSVFKKKIFGKIQVEKFLFLFSIATLFITFSRIGWMTVIFMVVYVVIQFMNKWIKKRTSNMKNSNSPNPWKQRLLRPGIWAGLFVGLLIVAFFAGLIMTKLEPRMAGFFDVQRLLNRGFLDWAAKLSLAERFMYWMAIYGVFQLFPIFGAGFGVPGFFFLQTVPDYGSQLLDINELILTKSYLPNAKNLWVRLLAETGIVGFALFVSWLVVHWRNANELERNSEYGLFKAMGLVGKLIVIAMIIEGFSLDSFGLPYYWVSLGLVAATWLIVQKEAVTNSEQTSHPASL